MTLDEARRFWEEQRQMDEGYLDAAARLERERPLTASEQEAIDVIWAAFVDAMRLVAKSIGRDRRV